MHFSELVKLLEGSGFKLVRHKGPTRYYSNPVIDKLFRVEHHGSRQVLTGTLNGIIKAAGLKERGKN